MERSGKLRSRIRKIVWDSGASSFLNGLLTDGERGGMDGGYMHRRYMYLPQPQSFQSAARSLRAEMPSPSVPTTYVVVRVGLLLYYVVA